MAAAGAPAGDGSPTRVLLFTGKGGVGKTTTAAATALRCADAGLRTLALSTDPAHSLADVFGVPLGPLVAPVADNLWGQQLDAQDRMEEAWEDIRRWLLEVFRWAGVEGLEAEELSVVPGLDEVFALADIRHHATSDEWDVVVVDCAPTAETVRLLSLPDVLARYMERVFPVGRRVSQVVSPLVARMTTLPVAGDDVFAATERFYERLAGVRELLTDGRRTSVRLVVTPERVVVAEARRTHTYLSLFGYHVDAVVANRVLPDGVTDPWFDRWREAHAEQLDAIADGFAPVPVLRAPLQPAEPVGAGALRALAEALYGDEDPTARLGEREPLRVRRDGAELVLELELPFTDRDELEVGRTGHELLVRVGPYRRGIVLPDALRRRRVSGAALRDGCLAVRFADPAGPAGDGDRAGAGPARGEGRPPTGAPSAGVPATGASSG
ncbi:MAG: ArsA family ATPase [Thermoanaerobacterales bacterium]|jgi:arsenite-transporting ATPase|nr:ArsA family ATPase [Thermoanaerobacterales bacterium]